ncbi:MAG: uncharacterized membrane protein YqaE (UPF0057 family) [Myxococcota bacterium]|jgi:uncharacterized membrane protein YqaE (UPF0057 family)
MSDSETTSDFIRAILGWFIPPVAVFLQAGVGVQLVINIVLTLMGWLPGAIHAAWVISSHGRNGGGSSTTFLSLLLCGLFPPIAVWMKRGLGVDLIVNLVLVWFFWLPGVLHAVWVAVQPD